jgi:hypothetical protein
VTLAKALGSCNAVDPQYNFRLIHVGGQGQ